MLAPQRHILHLSSQKLQASPWLPTQPEPPVCFANTPEGQEDFRRYLEQRKNHHFHLLLNLAEENFQRIAIPRLRGRERESLIQRKLQQHRYQPHLARAFSLGLDYRRRKEEQLLLAGLGESQSLSPWLQALQASETPLAGIHSLALLSTRLLHTVQPSSAPCLMLTAHDQSLRQSFFTHGALHFSRLTPLPDCSHEGLARGAAAEIERMHRYLLSQGLALEHTPLPILVFSHPDAHPAIQSACSDIQGVAVSTMDLREAAGRIGLAKAPEDNHSDALFTHLLAKHRPRQQLADRGLRRHYGIWRARAALSGGGLLIFATCLILASIQWRQTRELEQDSARIEAQTALAQRHYQTLAQAFPPLPADRSSLDQIASRYQALEQSETQPLSLYAPLSQALTASPAIHLESLDWHGEGNGTGTSGEGESLLVRGTIELPNPTTPRQILSLFQRFLANLAADQKLQVTVRQRPFDMESSRELKGEKYLLEQGSAQAPGRFLLHIRRNNGK